MTSQIRGQLRDDDDVTNARIDAGLTTRTQVSPDCLVGLDGRDDVCAERTLAFDHLFGSGHPQKPHATTARASSTNTTTSAMSSVDLPCGRNGLNPIWRMVGVTHCFDVSRR